jgi:ubiquitin-protein ligase
VILDLDGQRCPLHMSIRFPKDYPTTAPSAGFSCSDFGYNDGAVYVEKDRENYFYGKLIICLDILGNFAKVHDEWAGIAGSGWSPAYTISSLLLNVSVTLNECTSRLPKNAKDVLYKECMDFVQTFDTATLTPAFDAVTMSAAEKDEEPETDELLKQSNTTISPDQTGLTETATTPSDFRPIAQKYLKATIEHFTGMMSKFGEPPLPKVLEIAGPISDRLGALLMWHNGTANDVTAVKECLSIAGWDVKERCAREGVVISLAKLLKALDNLHSKGLCSSSSDSSQLIANEPDSSIACWYSFEHYTETVLGVGIALVRGKVHTTLSTDGELVSISAFEDGLRQTPTKAPFEYFLPAYICPTHSTESLLTCGRDWEQCIAKSIIQIGNVIRGIKERKIDIGKGPIDLVAMKENPNFANFVLRIYSDIINSLVVKIMQPESDVRASERVFRILMDCWRALYWFKQNYACVKAAVVSRVKSFTEQPTRRSKNVEANIGCLLALRTVVSDDEVPLLSFFHAYLEESNLRSVMWWKKSGVPEEPRAVFDATKVSRRLFLFQSLFLMHSITTDLDVTASLADHSECKLTDRLDVLLTSFKEEVELEEKRLDQRMDGQRLYESFFEACGCPYREATKDMSGWIRKHAQHAAVTDGYFFSNMDRGLGRGAGRSGGGYRGNNRW